jgi:hypothetical protein
MKTTKLLMTLALCLTLTACANLYKSTVAITSVVDGAMKSWAELSVGGFTTPDFDAEVKRAHAKYQVYCATAAKALRAYEAGTGTKQQYEMALENARVTALAVIEKLYFVLEPPAQEKARKQIKEATRL